MKCTRYLIACIIGLTLCTSAIAQDADRATDLHYGTHFEIAYGVLWRADGELPSQQPVRLQITSSGAGKVHITSKSTTVVMDSVIDVLPNKTTIILIQTDYLPSLNGGVAPLGISIVSTVPISVSTIQAYANNGSLTLHYPVETWGNSYSLFSYPQDHYGSFRIERRPGQIVVIAAFDSTAVTIHPRAAIAANAAIGSRIAANGTRTVMLQAHQTLTLLGEIDSTASHTASTDLTGTRITSNKPVAVMSGHTKGAIGFDDPTFYEPASMHTYDANAIRNNYYQTLLPDELADTAFVTIPMLYTSARTILDGDVVRVVALNNNTDVYRSKSDGSGYTKVASLQTGEYYSDTALTQPCRWTTSKPSMVAQYGRSFAVPGDYPFPEMILGGAPTMMIVPGEARWTRTASFYALEGKDNFLSVVMRGYDTTLILVDGKRIASEFLRPLPGTILYTARLPIEGGSHTITGPLQARPFMAWVYGGTDGLMSKSTHSMPVGVNLARMCIDGINERTERQNLTIRSSVYVISGTNCSSMLRYEVLSSTNATIDSVAFTTRPTGTDTIQLFVRSIDSMQAGSMLVRYTSTSGSTYESLIQTPAVTPVYIYHRLTREYIMAKPGEIASMVIGLDSAIHTKFKRCEVTVEYWDSTLVPIAQRPGDIVLGPGQAMFNLPITSHAQGAQLGTMQFRVQNTRRPASYVAVRAMRWFDDSVQVPNIQTGTLDIGYCFERFRIVVTPYEGSTYVQAEMPGSCAKMLYNAIYDAKNVRADSTVALDAYINVQLSLIDTTIGGSVLAQFVASTGQYIDTAITLQPRIISGLQEDDSNIRTSGVSLSISPQPAHDVVSIAYRKGPKGATLRLFDYAGNVVMDLSDKLATEEGSIPLSTSGLARGMYVMQLLSSEAACMTRLIVD